MTKKTNPPRLRALAAILCLTAGFAGQAQALLINLDITSSSGGDAYNTGAGVFGTTNSQWNERSRLISASAVALTDDTGSASPVTVTYTRSGSGSAVSGSLTGAFQNLGYSDVQTGTVTLNGLTPGAAYELAIFSTWSGTPSWTVGGQTKSIARTTDWSSLTEGRNYVLFQAVADGSGALLFTPNADSTSGNALTQSPWSAFQLQSAQAAAVPEPGSLALFGAGLAGLLARRRKPA